MEPALKLTRIQVSICIHTLSKTHPLRVMWSHSSLIWALEIAGYGNCLYMIAPATDGWLLSLITQSWIYRTGKTNLTCWCCCCYFCRFNRTMAGNITGNITAIDSPLASPSSTNEAFRQMVVAVSVLLPCFVVCSSIWWQVCTWMHCRLLLYEVLSSERT